MRSRRLAFCSATKGTIAAPSFFYLGSPPPTFVWLDQKAKKSIKWRPEHKRTQAIFHDFRNLLEESACSTALSNCQRKIFVASYCAD
ncbi:hypothetical protein BU23DRAFT_267834 [Bimuria novae-zelandiae CBS 107.79]|uniref:Uncharacterized protein n=1 Tax=Bimuria novae-zelandiae CBS 107.79 TaxID=1447943 RepID=A0A6A5UU02_9PLEO|nr:hypothetical protein BU23DRAFT_267834 [Bimuria novae-zelandiae CBS 107.79]